MLSNLFIKIEDEAVFLCFSAFFLTVVQKEWLPIDSRNAILDTFEEYYTCYVNCMQNLKLTASDV